MTRVNDSCPSKSARKREQLMLQALGEKLVTLPVPDLEAMDLHDALFEAIVEAKAIRSRGALRRQRQLIGKLMRDANAERIEARLAAMARGGHEANAVFHAAERWRDRVCTERRGALTAFAEATGHDARSLEPLLRELEAAPSEGMRRGVRRRLFREIHSALQSAANNGGGA